MSTQPRPLPQPSPWSAPYWEAARQRRFVIQACRACDRPIMYPRKFCPHCLGDDLEFRPSAGTGEIYTVTTQVAGPPSGFADALPYVIAVIRLDEGVQLMSNIVGDDRERARIGDRVRVDFETAGDGETVLPVFRLARAEGRAR
ncbi:MAG: OB-fold domain-containing protein [Ectothiorhodospiraceae bacterium]|nr:OB-fold domain-containing protein [Ectothiorhodospiraceae bacterium]